MTQTGSNNRSLISKLLGNSEDFSLEHRIFNAACLTVVVSGFLSSVLNLALNLNMELSVTVFVFSLVYLAIYFYSLKKHRYQPLVWLFIVIALGALTYLWFVNAGLNGTVLYFIFVSSIVFFSITKKGQRRYAVIALIAILTVLFYMEYKHPELITPYATPLSRFLDQYFSSIIILLVLSMVVSVIFDGYDEERMRVIRQRDEIADKTKLLEEAQQDLEAHKQNLEKLVAKRTNELQNESTMHKKTAEVLRQNEEMLRNIFESSLNGIIRTNLEGDVLYCNAAAKKMFGLTEDDYLEDRNIFDKMVNSEYAGLDHDQRIKRFFGIKRFEFERENNDIFPAECFVGIAKGDEEGDSSFVITIADISKRVKVEKELITAKEKAEESDKLKSAFLSNMSHEIRTPMNAILGFSNLLRRNDLSTMAREEYLAIIDEKGKHLLSIINDIIDFSKVEAGEMAIREMTVSLDKVMQELYYTCSNVKRKRNKGNIDLIYKFEIGTKNTFVKTDPVRFKQIMSNLLDNALKFTDKGYIEFGFRILKNESPGTVECFVKDSGIGISEENQKVIFNRFRKIEDVNNKFYDGTGLGLAISQKLAKLMDTEIQIKSKKGSGSEFTFQIPVAKSDIKDISSLKIVTSDFVPDWKGKKILIVDDELTSILLLKEYLQPAGIEVITARNGKEAIDALENGLKSDIILMDLRMPVIDGYTATSIIKEKYPEFKVIAQTAYVMPDDEDKARASGCDDFITKPISKEALFEKLALYLD
jgi:PAS domain S-box-containing protein